MNYAPGIEHAANRIGSPAEATPRQVVIDSVREGMVPGIHTVTYESEDDILELKHTIKNRRTLAMGAVIAAEVPLRQTGRLLDGRPAEIRKIRLGHGKDQGILP